MTNAPRNPLDIELAISNLTHQQLAELHAVVDEVNEEFGGDTIKIVDSHKGKGHSTYRVVLTQEGRSCRSDTSSSSDNSLLSVIVRSAEPLVTVLSRLLPTRQIRGTHTFIRGLSQDSDMQVGGFARIAPTLFGHGAYAQAKYRIEKVEPGGAVLTIANENKSLHGDWREKLVAQLDKEAFRLPGQEAWSVRRKYIICLED